MIISLDLYSDVDDDDDMTMIVMITIRNMIAVNPVLAEDEVSV